MRITQIRECAIPVLRYADPAIPSGGLTTNLVAVSTDVVRDGKPVVGNGFASMGRFAQGGLMRERFIPRLMDGLAPLPDAPGIGFETHNESSRVFQTLLQN
jgi:hypothetical protein